MKHKITIVLLVLLTSTLYSQTIINTGSVSGVWTKANSPYLIYGELNVADGQTLEIQSGVRVEFQGHYRFKVFGSLNANGAVDDSVLFTSKDKDTYWHGLWFMESGQNEFSTIKYSIIEKCNGDDGSSYSNNPDNNSGGFLISNYSNLIIRNCIIKNNKATITAGIAIYGSSPKIYNTKIIHNEGFHVVRSYDALNPEIVGCLIANNKGGVWIDTGLSSQGNAKITNCTIVNNTAINNISNPIISFVSGVTLKNSIIFGNIPSVLPVLTWGTKTVEFYNCDIEGGRNALSSTNPDNNQLIYNDNIEMPPIFADEALFNYSLAHSPCINSGGTNTNIGDYQFDITGKPRIFQDGYNIIDIGAYEYQNIVPNRTPFVRHLDRSYIFQATSKVLEYTYFDADKTNSHIVSLTTSNENVVPSLLELTNNVFKINVSVKAGFIDSAYIKFTLTDNSGYSNASFTDSTLIFANNEFEGIISTDIVFKDTVRVVGDITVEKAGKLTILPGACILFQGWYKIDVFGKFSAVGTNENRITLNSSDTTVYQFNNITVENGWRGINFYNKVSDTTHIKYCNFLNTGLERGNYYSKDNTTVLIMNSANFTFDECLFESNFTRYSSWDDPRNSGVSILYSKNISVNNSKFIRCRSRGINGAYIQAWDSETDISNCVFDKCETDEPNGNTAESIRCSESYSGKSTYTLKKNIFQNLKGCSVSLRSDKYIFAENLAQNNIGFTVTTIGNGIVSNNKFFNNITFLHAVLESLYYPSKIIGNLFVNNRLECKCSNFLASSLYLEACNALVANNTFVSNFQDANGETCYASYCSPTLINNIFWNNNHEGFGYYNGATGMVPPIVYNNLIPGGYGNNNYDFDPEFSLIIPYNYQLSSSSKCINLGVLSENLKDYLPVFDIDGNKRIDTTSNKIDLGAYESEVSLGVHNFPNPKPELFEVFSNPLQDRISIKFNLSGTKTISLDIIDMQGRKIIGIPAKTYNNAQVLVLDSGNLTSGIYIIRCKSFGITESKKIIIKK